VDRCLLASSKWAQRDGIQSGASAIVRLALPVLRGGSGVSVAREFAMTMAQDKFAKGSPAESESHSDVAVGEPGASLGDDADGAQLDSFEWHGTRIR